MAKEKLNKDGLTPGAEVSDKDHARIINEQRRKDPYNGVPPVVEANRQAVPQQNTVEYQRQLATDRMQRR